MKITQYLHTAILVSDLSKAENFYGQVLGLTRVDRVLKYPGVWYQLGNYQIHLIVNQNFKNSIQNPEKIGRNPHIALGVDDLEAAKQQLENQGYPFEVSASGRAALFTQDPDGNIIEITQI
jgi:glyoxylase I family protein